MNHLTKKYLDDALPHTRPSYHKQFIEDFNSRFKDVGDVVRIEDLRRPDGSIYQRRYYHKKGLFGDFTAIRYGLREVPA